MSESRKKESDQKSSWGPEHLGVLSGVERCGDKLLTQAAFWVSAGEFCHSCPSLPHMCSVDRFFLLGSS